MVQFISAEEVSKMLGISRSKSYQLVRDMNKELKSQGYITIAGKCPIQYFKHKLYGFQPAEHQPQDETMQA